MVPWKGQNWRIQRIAESQSGSKGESWTKELTGTVVGNQLQEGRSLIFVGLFFGLRIAEKETPLN